MASNLTQLVLAASKKRKERDEANEGFKPPPQRTKAKPDPINRVADRPAIPFKNRLLAGYLAHEFLTRGAILSLPFDAVQAESDDPVDDGTFADVARLLRHDGTHIKGLVNPTQLGCWIKEMGGLRCRGTVTGGGI